MTIRSIRICLAFLFAVFCMRPAFGQTAEQAADGTADGTADQAQAFALPQDPRAWINSPPISLSAMSGKSVVLYFFEEDCPGCRAKWPDILAGVREMQSEPVLLIAVNSGSRPEEVLRYVKQVGITVPVIMDPYRTLEKAADVKEVSLNNIWVARMVKPDGTLVSIGGSDIPASLKKAAEIASWNVDPSDLPPEMMGLWRQVEFGDYAAAARQLNRLTRDRRPEIKQAAEKLQSYVDQKRDEAIADAQADLDAGNSWKAYRGFEAIEATFQGNELPDSVSETLSQLKSDDAVKNEMAAMKLWLAAQKTINSGRAKAARVQGMMKRITDKYPGTEAAAMAAELVGNQ